MLTHDMAIEIYIAIVAIGFTTVGLWVATRFRNPNAPPVDHEEVQELALTAREYEVLQLLTQGLSNAEIAEKLFLSLSTVKTHVSALFVKMKVKSRTQAVEKANRLRIMPPAKLIL